MKIARITLSDRASKEIYADQSGPEIERILCSAFDEAIHFEAKILADEYTQIKAALEDYITQEYHLIVTTGGTGPSKRDITPEATQAILEKELPGFGEIMRMASYKKVKTAILSRATAGIANKSLITNLPGNPKAIGECLPLLLPAIAEALDHICNWRPKLK